ncbi:hypothetical protein WA158_005885 [Blastocystis sp. Blastoise]
MENTAAKLDNAPDHINFSEAETSILEYWKKIDAFKTSLKLSEGKPEFSFYDGPPFATGLPHYGHILAGTIKDIVTRYAHQTGHHVTRRFGWDCHGLPVEYEIDKKLNITCSQDVDKIGIATYNAECRSIVSRYTKEWEEIVGRLGRWIDFEHGYKTLEPWYMESVWWVFKTLFEKGLVYRGFRVMPFSTACTTPLSNFEANLNYKEVSDPAIILSFKMKEDESVAFLAWTTTPWTLPSNLALVVHPEFKYVKIHDIAQDKKWIVAESRLCALYPKMEKKGYKGGEFEVLESYIGKDLVGKEYVPLFDYFKDWPNAFHVIADTYVTDDSGTGIVHCAPGFGEDDYRVGLANGIIVLGGDVPCPIDLNGKFDSKVSDYQGRYVKDCDNDIMTRLKKEGKLINKASIKHSYPYCWRSETPLIYRAISSWFVSVTSIKEQLIKNNEQTYWVPAFVKEKRFHNWLKDARDWNISRNRYWGTPIPIWISDDGEEIVVVGSIQELRDLTGNQDIKDIHRESIDSLTIPSKQGKGMLHRVSEVFDCWFESGSMPYAQQHYPFENQDLFKSIYPADFIAEGLDQTRGWFYTLMVLSTALFDKPAFKNLIVNVLASDGKKMSKRLKNYPDPMLLVDKYGADAIRLYLINSPVVRAEPLKFQELGVQGVIKDVFLPWYNAYRFLIQNIDYWEHKNNKKFIPNVEQAIHSDSVMDKWLLASVQDLVCFVKKEMEGYRLYTVVPKLIDFIEKLTNCYVRLNRLRIKGGDNESYTSLCTLYETLLTLCRLMSPFTPFFTEYLYQNLRKVHPNYNNESVAIDEIGRSDSIHYVMFPSTDMFSECDDPIIRRQVDRLMQAIELGRILRERKTISLKMPIRSMTIISENKEILNDIQSLENFLKDELNCFDIIYESNEDEWCTTSFKPNFTVLGKKLGKGIKDVKDGLDKLTSHDLKTINTEGKITVAGFELLKEELLIVREIKNLASNYEGSVTNDFSFIGAINCEQDQEVIDMGIAREFINRVQRLRKTAGLVAKDMINVYYEFEGEHYESIQKSVETTKQHISDRLNSPIDYIQNIPSNASIIIEEKNDINDIPIKFILTHA